MIARQRYSAWHVGYLLVTGVLGWGLLAVALTQPLPGLRLGWPDPTAFAIAMALGLIARVLTFQFYENVRIAIDSAFYTASGFVLGVGPAALVIASCLTLDTFVRWLMGKGQVARGEASTLAFTAQLLFNGGLPAISFVVTGALFQVDSALALSDLALGVRVVGFSLSMLVWHYALAGVASWLQGRSLGEVTFGFVLPVVAFEALMLPLSIAMVLGYATRGLLYFGLLGSSYLLFNALFRFLAETARTLRQRVEELSTLNTVGRLIASSLQLEELQANIARSTLELLGEGARFMIGLFNEATRQVDFQLFDREGRSLGRRSIAWGEGLSGWVMAHNEPLVLSDVQRQYRRYVKDDRYNDPRFHSWIGVPLSIYDEVIGIMSVQIERRAAFNDDTLRVLATIARQAAVAIQNARLYQLATVDGLSTLYVRRYFDQRLEEEWHRCTRYGSSFSVLIMDLDNFKMLNDVYGHQVGDRVIRRAAQVTKRNLRGADIAARYGGEEFSCILPRTGLEAARMVADRIRADLANQEILAGDTVIKVTASLGVAAYPESGPDSFEDMVAKADAALYEAKRAGKNRVQIYDPHLAPAS